MSSMAILRISRRCALVTAAMTALAPGVAERDEGAVEEERVARRAAASARGG